MIECTDEAGWRNPYGLSCMDYAGKGYCAHGKATPGSEWTLGTSFNSPEINCCTCGRWKLPNRSALAADQERAMNLPGTEAVPFAQNLTAVQRCFDTANPSIPWGWARHRGFCPAWPKYDAGAELSAADRERLRRAAALSIAPFRGRLSRSSVRAALRPSCAQRLCMLVQIRKKKLYVVAPRAEPCSIGHTGACSVEARARTKGVYQGWGPGWSPTGLVSHWYAGFNVSSCSTSVLPGDWNGKPRPPAAVALRGRV